MSARAITKRAASRPVVGRSYKLNAKVTGGSESRAWRTESAHCYVYKTYRDVYVWVRHGTVRASICVKVRVPRG